MSDEVRRAIDAIASGGVVVIPTDTVYGLACSAASETAARRMYALKGRAANQPTAIVAATVDVVLACIPDLPETAARVVEALLPGPYTLVLPNRARRYPWLTGDRPDALGVRVPALEGAGFRLVEAAGAVAATSANRPGGDDPRRVADLDPGIRAGADAVVDGGELPGTPSTVVDLTGAEPVVLRAGAVTAADAVAHVRAALDRGRVRPRQGP